MAEDGTKWPDMIGWFALLLAGLMEIAWALGLYSDGGTRLWPSIGTAVALGLSFVFLGLSLRSVPFGTAYAVWTGIGAAGAVIIGMLLFEERADFYRVTYLVLILVGIIGLRFTATP
jgi:quaternary ammonium compound-resistance protein SugE